MKEAIVIPPLYNITKDQWYKDHNITESELPNGVIYSPIEFTDKKDPS